MTRRGEARLGIEVRGARVEKRGEVDSWGRAEALPSWDTSSSKLTCVLESDKKSPVNCRRWTTKDLETRPTSSPRSD